MFDTLKEKLEAGVVIFQYKSESTGETRTAAGTLKQELIGRLTDNTGPMLVACVDELRQNVDWNEADGSFHPDVDLGVQLNDFLTAVTAKLKPKEAKAGRKPNEAVQTYYDIEKGGFRSFRKDNLIAIL